MRTSSKPRKQEADKFFQYCRIQGVDKFLPTSLYHYQIGLL